MNNELISVIVPVYNVENYLDECLISLINQTYRNIEIILIDDGSTDRSGTMCDEYTKKDNRIRVYHNQNHGAAYSRNYGVKYSKGLYIVFVDSDDKVLENYITNLYEMQKRYSADIVVSSFKIVKKNNIQKNKIKKIFQEELNCKEALRKLLSNEFTVSPCSKLFSKKILLKNPFPNLFIYEDDAIMYKIIMECNKIVFTNFNDYLYCIRKDSITNKNFSQNIFILLKICKKMENDIYNQYPDLNNEIIYKKIICYFRILRQIPKHVDNKTFNKQVKICHYLKSNRKLILTSKKYNIYEKFAIVILCLNVNLYKTCYKIYKHLT